MATTANTNPAVKTAKVKKPPVAASVRITDQLKRAALGGKITADELDKLAALAGALKTFMTA